MKLLIPLALMLFSTPSFAANECAGTPYRTLGLSCAQIGLDSNRAVCRAGDRHAMMCDDTRHGQIRTCPSSIRCDSGPDRRGYGYPDRADRDHGHYGPRIPRGGRDGRGGRGGRDGRGPPEGTWSGDYVFFQGDWAACWDLRFSRNGQPRSYCEPGRINRDCRGRCERY